MKSKWLLGLFILITTNSFISGSLIAKEGEGYIGIGAGKTDYDNQLLSKPTGRQFYLGNHYTKNWGLEFGYVDFAEAKTKQSGTSSLSRLEGQTISLGIKYRHSMIWNLNFYGKFGIHRWDLGLAEYNLGDIASDKGTDLFYGAGITYDFNKKYSLGVGYSSYNLDFGNDIDTDVTLTSLNFEWKVD